MLSLCHLIFACCIVRSYFHNCPTTPSFSPSCFPQQPTAQSHPLSFTWKNTSPVLSVGFPPSLASRDRLLDPESLDPLPSPWKRGILKQPPGGRWGHLFCCPQSQQFLLLAALASPGLSPAIAAGHPHAQFGSRGLVTRARQTPESQHHPSSSVTQSFTCEETPPLLPNSTGFLLHSAGFQLLPHHNFSLAFLFFFFLRMQKEWM